MRLTGMMEVRDRRPIVMETVIVEARQRALWDSFVAASPYGHVLQSWEWGEVKARSGWQVTRLALGVGEQWHAAAQIQVRPLPFGFGKVAYVPKGPVLDYQDPALLRAMLNALRGFARAQGAISLKIEPEVVEPSEVGAELVARGLTPAPPVQLRSTIWVDLAPSEDKILAGMKQKTRYNIRLAARKGVEVSAAGREDLAAWYAMYETTARRDGFTIHDLAYYRAVLEHLQPAGLATLLLARYAGAPLAGIIIFLLGEKAQYMYGASSNESRNLMAPYLVQWEGMRWAKAHGATIYDLWGIPDVLAENEDLWGVYRHKRGFGGEIVRYLGAYDLVRSAARHLALERVARPLLKRVARLAV